MSEGGQPKSDPPASGKTVIAKLNAYRNIILAVAALATAVGSWFRPTDTTATKNSFGWTSTKIEQLSENEVKMHEDLVALHAYLDGLTKGQVPTESSLGSIGTIGHGAGGSGLVRTRRPRKPPSEIKAAGPPVQIQVPLQAPMAMEAPPVAEAVAEPAPQAAPEPIFELPALKGNPSVVRHPKFEDVAFGAAKK